MLFSTVAAKLGMPFHASIAVAKSGVEGLVKSLGAELAPTLRINAIAPTVTDTDLASKLLRNEKMIENIIEKNSIARRSCRYGRVFTISEIFINFWAGI